MSALDPSRKLNIYVITATGLLDDLEALARFRRRAGLDTAFVDEAIDKVFELNEILSREDLPKKRAAPPEPVEDDDLDDWLIPDITTPEELPRAAKKEQIPIEIAPSVTKTPQIEAPREKIRFKSRRW